MSELLNVNVALACLLHINMKALQQEQTVGMFGSNRWRLPVTVHITTSGSRH